MSDWEQLGYWVRMQVIAQEYDDMELDVKGELHRQVRGPLCCPQCSARGMVWALGYYWRYVFGLFSPKAIRIGVRRFRCRECAATVSMLPAFAQPHHLLGNDLLDELVSGKASVQEQRHGETFRRMLKRFGFFRQKLFSEIGLGFGRDPPEKEVPDLDSLRWLWSKNHKKFQLTTSHLIRHYRCTVFGQYRCHQRI